MIKNTLFLRIAGFTIKIKFRKTEFGYVRETLNKEISFEQEEKYKEDKFGRTLGYIFVDGINLNVELVRNRFARVVLYEKKAKIKYQDELLSAESEAKIFKVGIWKK